MSDKKQKELPRIPLGQPSDPGAVSGYDSLANGSLVEGGGGKGDNVQSVRTKAQADAKGSGKRIENPTVATPPASDQQPLPKALRAPRKRSKKAVDALEQGQPAVHAPLAASQVIPPLTDEAATFLGKPDATPADLLKLGPDSIAFVRHHYNFMEEVEASSRLNNAYLMANTRPVSPAFQKFVDALVKQAHIKPSVGQKLPVAKVAEPTKQVSRKIMRASYGQKATTAPAYTPVAIQFGKIELAIENPHHLHYPAQDSFYEKLRLDTKAFDEREKELAKATPEPAGDGGKGPDDRIAVQGAKELVEANRVSLGAEYADDYSAKSAERKQAERMEVDAYKKLATVGLDRADALVAAERANTKDGQLQVSIKLDPAKYQHAASQRSVDQKGDPATQKPEGITVGDKKPKAVFDKTGYTLPDSVKGKYTVDHIENSIEPTHVPLIANEQQVPTAAAPAAQVAAAAAKRVGVGERFLASVGGAAHKAGVWLSDRGKASEQLTTKVSPSETKREASSAAAAAAAVPVAAGHDKSTFVPEAVARRFLKVEQDYFFPDRTPAFIDRGNKLATRGANPEVVRSLVEIARARGWDNITVKGTDEFRRSAWIEAAQNGLKVVGYQPTPLDLAELSSRPAKNSLEKGTVKEKGSPSREQATAKYSKAGPTPTTTAVLTEKGGTSAVQNLKLDRERAEKAKAFEENKPAFVVKKYPDLVGAYGIVEAAKAFAVEKLPEAARDEFVGMARRHVMHKIITGDTVKGPKIYMATAKTREAADSAMTSVQGAADLGKSPRTKEVPRER